MNSIAPFNSISHLLGYLVIAEDGAVLSSGGDLENDEKTSESIHKLITISHSLDPAVYARNSLQKITIAYDDFSYSVTLSNRKIFIAKKKNVK